MSSFCPSVLLLTGLVYRQLDTVVKENNAFKLRMEMIFSLLSVRITQVALRNAVLLLFVIVTVGHVMLGVFQDLELCSDH